MGKNPTVLRAAKHAYRRVRDMSWDDADDYLMAKNDQARFFDPEHGREQGMKQFLDEKTYRPGLSAYRRELAEPRMRLPSDNRSRLDRLLRPRSVAIVGVSPEPGHMGGSVLANLERCRFDGDIHLVSRSRTEINGRPCVPSIDDLPHGVDAAVLVIPQTAVIDAIGACGRRGVGAAIVFASGYAEVGDAGRAEQEQLAAAARAANVAVLGPNCIGMCSFAVGAALTFEFNVERPPATGAPKIGMVAQSGAIAAIMRMAFLAKGLGVSFYVSTGNEADLTAEDFLGALIDDDDTKVAALFVEQIRHPQRFLALAQARPRARQADRRDASGAQPARARLGKLAHRCARGRLRGDDRAVAPRGGHRGRHAGGAGRHGGAAGARSSRR